MPPSLKAFSSEHDMRLFSSFDRAPPCPIRVRKNAVELLFPLALSEILWAGQDPQYEEARGLGYV